MLDEVPVLNPFGQTFTEDPLPKGCQLCHRQCMTSWLIFHTFWRMSSGQLRLYKRRGPVSFQMEQLVDAMDLALCVHPHEGHLYTSA